MTVPGELLLHAVWGAREEDHISIVHRMSETLEFLQAQGGRIGSPLWSTEPRLVSGAPETLKEIVFGGYGRDEGTGKVHWEFGTSFSLLQEPYSTGRKAKVKVNAHVGNRQAVPTIAANTISVSFIASGSGKTAGERFPVEIEVLPKGLELVRELVRIWSPDAASLDCDDLIDLQWSEEATYPIVGFVTWLGDAVVAGDHSEIQVAHRERLENGTLLSVDLKSDHLLEEGSELVNQVFDRGILRPIPVVQGDARAEQ